MSLRHALPGLRHRLPRAARAARRARRQGALRQVRAGLRRRGVAGGGGRRAAADRALAAARPVRSVAPRLDGGRGRAAARIHGRGGAAAPLDRRGLAAARVLAAAGRCGADRASLSQPRSWRSFPGAREPLAAACRRARLRRSLLPRRAAEINIESSDLQADGRRDGVIVLQRAAARIAPPSPQEYPALELTLDRRAPDVRCCVACSMPRDYLDASRPLPQGIAAGDEVAVRLYLDPGARPRATGYKIRHFYP